MHTSRFAFSVPVLLALAVPALAGSKAQPLAGWAEYLAPSVRWVGRFECVEMLSAILKGDPPSDTSGWFHPGQSRYGWSWLAQRYDTDGDGIISRDEFTGPAPFFERLDRDHDGKLTPADLDWSERSPVARQAQFAERLFRRVDANSDGRLSAAEWQAIFQQAAKGKECLTPEDVQRLLFPPTPPPPKGPARGMPSAAVLLRGLLTGEIGSPFEGPAVGSQAPAFRLATHDGTRHIALSDYRGKVPVVLVFGSFT